MKYLIIILGLVTLSFAGAKPLLKGELNLGYSNPLGDLALLIEPGIMYQTHFFGGVKVKGGAAGFGIDFSFTDYPIAHNELGHYRRFTTDFLFFPLSSETFSLTPGLNISMSDIYLSEFGINEFSIRPALLLESGIHFSLSKKATLHIKYRYEYIIQDEEHSTSQNRNLNISGQFGSLLGGIQIIL